MSRDEAATPVAAALWLESIGGRLREGRLRMRVSVIAAAQAAGVSRVTWHRMEAGSPSVSAGSYARALDALDLIEAEAPSAERPVGHVPTRIRVGDWPELAALAWSLNPETELSPREALELYERNGRHLDGERISEQEAALIRDLRVALEGSASDGLRP